MSESPSPSPIAVSPREALLALRATTRDGTPVPVPECPAAGVFVLKMSGARYMQYLDAVRPFDDRPGDSPEQAEENRRRRTDVQLRFAAVDAAGDPLFRDDDDDLCDLLITGTADILGTFLAVNEMVEKKAPRPSGSPAGSPSSAAGGTSPGS